MTEEELKRLTNINISNKILSMAKMLNRKYGTPLERATYLQYKNFR